jgi:signal peptidase I
VSNNPFYKDPLQADPRKKYVNILQVLAGFALFILLVWFTVLGQNQVDGPSMRPNFYTGEFLILNRIPQFLGSNLATTLGVEYKRGEVIVFTKPGFPDLLKRVIGLPGETVSINKGKILINGQVLDEEYIPEKIHTNGSSLIKEGQEGITVPEGHFFMVGDNRPESSDSRTAEIGFVKREWIKGKVILRIWPFDRFSGMEIGEYQLVDESNFDFSKSEPGYRNAPIPE